MLITSRRVISNLMLPSISRTKSAWTSGTGPRVGLFQDVSEVQQRELGEIIETERLLAEKVWYDRFQMTCSRVEEGTLKVVPDAQVSRCNHEIAESVWKNAKVVEDEHGLDDVGPYTVFEWGFLNGKLSAIRGVLGEEWITSRHNHPVLSAAVG